MKKLLLLCALICAGQLYGMEPLYPGMEKMGAFGEMPADIHQVIIQKAIESSNTLEKAIQAINVASALRGVKYDNLKDFTKLVHMLADKFDALTSTIAKQFNTPIADEYYKFGHDLIANVQYHNLSRLTLLIQQGADVNYSTKCANGSKLTPLRMIKNYISIYGNRIPVYKEIEQILINAGAKE